MLPVGRQAFYGIKHIEKNNVYNISNTSKHRQSINSDYRCFIVSSFSAIKSPMRSFTVFYRQIIALPFVAAAE